jgi:hypothetical protein
LLFGHGLYLKGDGVSLAPAIYLESTSCLGNR